MKLLTGKCEKDFADDKNIFTHKSFKQVEFRNGYGKNAPKATVEFKGIEIKEGREDWGAEKGKKYFVIKLGEILSKQQK